MEESRAHDVLWTCKPMIGSYVIFILTIGCFVRAWSDYQFARSRSGYNPATSPSCLPAESTAVHPVAPPISPLGPPITAFRAELSEPSIGHILTDTVLTELMERFDTDNSIQAKKLVEEYIGQRLKGVLRMCDASQLNSNCVQVMAESEYVEEMVILYFRDKIAVDPQLYMLIPGSYIEVTGKIHNVTADGVVLDDCELVRVLSAPRKR